MTWKKSVSLTMVLLCALSALNAAMTSVSALEYPAIYVDPASTVDETIVPGNNYTIAIKTDYTGDDIWGWQFTVSFNPTVLNAIEVVNGGLISGGTATFIPPSTIDNTAGTISLTAAFFYYLPGWTIPTTSGPGTLAYVTFTVVGTGDSDITLGPETQLQGSDGTDTYIIINGKFEPDHLGHGYFSNVGVAPPNEPPVAMISAPTSGIVNESVTFDGTGSYDPDGIIVSYSWDFGDGTTATGVVVTHTYTAEGIYTVTLVVTDDKGATGSATHTIEVTAPPPPPPALAADLVKWKVKPEAHHWVESKDVDGLVTLTALARNLGTDPVNVEITFAILDAKDGAPAGTALIATATLTTPGEDVAITVDLDPYLYGYDGVNKVVLFPHVTLRYDSDGDGTYDAEASTKIVRFAVVP